jgi:tetratricopeptide (TPR) repeat protein
LAAVERFAGADRPVVVTCRTREFVRAEAAAGALSRAAVVRLEPLEPGDVVRFLSFPQARVGLWDSVFEVLRSQPSGPLAQTLSTPLMAGLAKDTYADADPGVLVASATREELTGRLIDGYVASVYGPAMGRVRYRPQDAARWLGSLAYLAYLDGTRDLRWWRLPWQHLTRRPHRTVWMRVAVPALAAAVLVGAVLSLWFSWRHAAQVGLAAGAMAAACVSGVFNRAFEHEFQPAPPGTPWGWRWLVRLTGHPAAVSLALRGLFGVTCGAVAGLAIGEVAVAVAAGLLCGLGPGSVRVLRWRPAWLSRSGPAGTLRVNHLHAAMAAAVYGLIAAVVFAIAAALLGRAVSGWALAGAASLGAGAGLAGGAGTWLRFRLTQLALALSARRGRASLLPTRIVTLLKDGTHPDRGTIRVNGSAWQFRHAVIQDHLLRHARLLVLHRRVDAGTWSAALALVGLVREKGNLDELLRRRHRAAAGGLLREQGNLDEAVAVLRRHADAGDGSAAHELAGLLREQGNLDEAVAVLRHRADAGNRSAAYELAGLLREQGNIDELRRHADAGNRSAAHELAGLLREQGNLDEAVAVLRHRADAGDWSAAYELAGLLREQGNLDEAAAVLRHLADANDWSAGHELVGLLREQGIDELRRRADADPDDWFAASALAGLLREQGNLDELRRRADAGNWPAGQELAGLLREQGNLDER